MYDNDLVADKLRRWKQYLESYHLPAWEEIPDIGLYMEQVVQILKLWLDYLPPELKEEQFITASTVNNYVRTKIMPMPVKKKYYRVHIAYLLIICTLKQGLSLSLIQRLLPGNLTEKELKPVYTAYVNRHGAAARYFCQQVSCAASPLLGEENDYPLSADRVEDLVASSAVIGAFSRLFAEKLLLLEGMTPETEKKSNKEGT